MSLPKCKDFTDYNKYPGEENPTTDAQMQEYMDNQNQLMKAASAMMWQPSSEYEVGDIVISPAMPANTEAVCVTAGMTDSVLEPSWAMGNNIPDGSCFWKLRYVHYTSFLATEEEAAAGTDTEKIMTPAAVKAAVGSMNAASATKLEVPRNINEVAFDGTTDITIDVGVKTINAVSPDADGNIALQGLPVTHIPADSNLDDYTETGVYTCWLTNNAKTLTNNPMSAKSTGIILEVTVDGSNIFQKIYGTLAPGMYTRRCNNGSWNEWKKLNAEYATAIGGASPTIPAVVVTSYQNGNNWYRVWSDGWVEQGGLLTETGSAKTISLHTPMADTNYTAQITLLGTTTGTCYAPFVNNTSTTTITFYGNGNAVLNAKKVWVVYGKGA